jgi:hypothetical protein
MKRRLRAFDRVHSADGSVDGGCPCAANHCPVLKPNLISRLIKVNGQAHAAEISHSIAKQCLVRYLRSAKIGGSCPRESNQILGKPQHRHYHIAPRFLTPRPCWSQLEEQKNA